MKCLFKVALPLFMILFSISSYGEVKELGQQQDWNAISDTSRSICYVFSTPKKAQAVQGSYSRRGPAYITVSIRPKDGVKGEIAYAAGYPYKEGVPVKITINGTKTFNLVSRGESAWAVDDEKGLLQAMLNGRQMVVVGTSTRGTVTQDTYSLKGITASWQKAEQACR